MSAIRSDDVGLHERVTAQQVSSVYVYEAPVRIWHWLNALCVTVLAVTGWFIASPPPSVSGDASKSLWMGYIRFAHFTAAYVSAIGFLFRIFWAFVGNHHARQLFRLPVANRAFWADVLYEARWYLFLEKRPKKYIGHNPLAQFMMFCFFTLGVVFMCCTGFALYSEGEGLGSWQDRVFGWVIPLSGGSQVVHSLHHLGMWMFACFAITHTYAAIREDIMSRQSLISTMISGWRMFKD
jgi:Ni/Fe-hydrogenase 1 B-type cytochrome subunit